MKDIEEKPIKEWKDLSPEENAYYEADSRYTPPPSAEDIQFALQHAQISDRVAEIMLRWEKSNYEPGVLDEADWQDALEWLNLNGYTVYSPLNRFGLDFYAGDPSPTEWERYHCEPRIMDYMYFEDDLRKGIINTLTTLEIDPEEGNDDPYVGYLESILYLVYEFEFVKYRMPLTENSFLGQTVEIVDEPILEKTPAGYRSTHKMARLKIPYEEVDKVKLAQLLDEFFGNPAVEKWALSEWMFDTNGSHM